MRPGPSVGPSNDGEANMKKAANLVNRPIFYVCAHIPRRAAA